MSNESRVVGWVTMSRSAGRQRDQDQAMADFGQTRGALNFEPSFDTCILGKISRMEAFNEQFFSRLLWSGLGWWDDSWQVEYWTSWIPWGVWFWGAGMLAKWLWWTWSLSKDDVSLLVCYDVFSFFQISKNDRNDIFAKIVPGNLIGAIRISVLVSFFWEVKAKLGVGDSQLTGDGGSIQIRWLAQFHQVSWSTWS